MNWDNLLDRLRAADIEPIEEFYTENYGKVLASERQEFKGRYFRCTYGVLHCSDIRFEVLLFPSESQLAEFLEVLGDDPWYIPTANAVLHFPECDPALIDNILNALAPAPR